MLSRDVPTRVAGLSALLSLLLFGLCIAGAVYLYREQAATADSLGENIGSRRVARDLQVTLEDLLSLTRTGTARLDALQHRVREQLAQVRQSADKTQEARLVAQLENSYQRFASAWREHPREQSTLATLEKDTLPACQQLISFNAEQIELAELDHRTKVRRMALGLGILGTVGSLLGALLGYQIARNLRHSLYQISICVRDAVDRLGQTPPTINLSGTGDLTELRTQMRGVVRDIEQTVERLQQREREVLRGEQLAAVGQLAAGAAHELRNPLTSIKLLIQADQALAQKANLPTRHLAIIEQEIRRMERCLQMLVDFARPPSPEFRTVDLVPVVQQTLGLITGRAAKQQVVIQFTPPPETMQVQADPEQLQQVLVNLTLNALDAMPEGGTLQVRLHPEASALVMEILDTGPGIAPTVLPRLFEPFLSTKETGTGLGLVVSQRIVDNHGGQLLADNRPEGGARFQVRLPRR